MWQTHYLLHRARMDALLEEADRERRWRIQDLETQRHAPGSVGRPAWRLRGWIAGWLAAASKVAARLARRLDERVVVDLGPDRLLRDA